MRVFKDFAGAFFVFFGVFILYFNLVMALNVVGSSNHITPFLGLYALDNTRWTDQYYFGWDSIWSIIDDLPTAFQFDNFLSKFETFVQTLNPLGELLGGFTYDAGGYSNIVEQILNAIKVLFTGLFSILTAPFQMLVAFIELNVYLFQTIIEGLTFIYHILDGRYNTPMNGWDSPLGAYMTNTPLPHTSNGVSVPQVISVGVSGGVVTVQ